MDNQNYIDIVFDGPPGPDSATFIDVHNPKGQSISIGQWHENEDGFWSLRISPSQIEAALKYQKLWPESGNVARTRWLPDEQILEITFNNGSTYHYKDVPVGLWEKLVQAESIGSFINREVKDNYRYEKQTFNSKS